jgi:hypothetical protein
MSIEERKNYIRAALQELQNPASTLCAYEAMEKLHRAVRYYSYGLDGSIGDFEGDDEFLKEIFSARIVQVVMDVIQGKEEYPPRFYRLACGIVSVLCWDNTELANAFVAHDGVEFLLETLETLSSIQVLLCRRDMCRLHLMYYSC